MEFKDEAGKVIRQDIVKYRDLYHMARVIVVGKLRADGGGNRFLEASGFFIEAKTQLDVEKTERLKKSR